VEGEHLGVEILLSQKESEIREIYSIIEKRVHDNEEQVSKVKDFIESEYK